jgi:hypothetical protein
VDVFFTYFDSLFGLKICDFRVPAHPISPSNQPIQSANPSQKVWPPCDMYKTV